VVAPPPPAAAAKPAKPAPAPRPPGSRAPGSFETKVLTALKRHGGAAVSFSASPDHIKAAFKRCLVEGWATGTIDSGSITPQGEKVLEKLNPEIRAFPAPTLRNRLNDALFRNQGNRPAAPAAAAAAPAPDAEDAAEEEDDTVPEAEEEEVEAVDADDPDVEKAA
jgi:ribosomal protein L12E/L44/L45/RPP1/RPP2